MRPSRLIASALPLFGTLLLFLATSGFRSRSRLALSGVVVSSDTRCQQPQNNRCVSTYLLRQPSGVQFVYVAASDDVSLQRRLPVGTFLEKSAGVLSYRVNGVIVDDFPFVAYSVATVIGAVLIIGGGSYLFLNRHAA